ncbi:MAG: hypothetical protein ABH822_01870 [Patescibacteria group bacterium]
MEKELNNMQKVALQEFVKAYFEGGNSRVSENSPGMLKARLDAIRDFVLENF